MLYMGKVTRVLIVMKAVWNSYLILVLERQNVDAMSLITETTKSIHVMSERASEVLLKLLKKPYL